MRFQTSFTLSFDLEPSCHHEISQADCCIWDVLLTPMATSPPYVVWEMAGQHFPLPCNTPPLTTDIGAYC